MLRQFDIAYFMASVDDLQTNREFAKMHEADFPLLSDTSKEVARAYGVVNNERPLAMRWTFYIGPDGKILKIDRKVNPATSGEDIVAALKQLSIKRR